MRRLLLTAAVIASLFSMAHARQISVPRIELMPLRPTPYLMRPWNDVARAYDAYVFDSSKSGQYLPLVWSNTQTVNYPAQASFGLHTVVGTTVPQSAEAINCLPAVVGATLAGAPNAQRALMCREWFNNRAAQDVYKNHPVDDGGDDWWYETMPNVFFYQLNWLYPQTPDFDRQFTAVAQRWLTAQKTMGGSITPWQIPNMNHRGWLLQTMTPYDAGVKEPEAAGAIAWLEYQAWTKTHDPSYRIGAEWGMEFLNSLSSNPAYELQLPYGAYLAARMNAEIGTTYDIQKMVNWCFDVGPLRSWGAIVGKWGGYDCSGLIGEVNGSNDYAFLMNTFEQAGALVPMVRYDDRFARAIGKWVLNAANAARLLYPDYLPDANQDSRAWSSRYDSASVIAHEAMRQSNGAVSPYATGDAVSGGWGATTLTLYGSSHVGIFGGIIDTTDVPMILRLDLLKTDYYHDTAYPSYLLFNPYDSAKTITFDAGAGVHDLYDAASNAFLLTGAGGAVPLPIAGNTAAVIVVAPAGGAVTYDLDKMLIDGVVVDYRSGHFSGNHPPRVKSLAPARSPVLRGDTIFVFCAAADADGDTLAFSWQAPRGTFLGSGKSIRWAAPLDSTGTVPVRCIVTDGHGGADTADTAIVVALAVDALPVITGMTAVPRKVDLGASMQITCFAFDPDAGDTLSYAWRADSGLFSGSGAAVSWTAPATPGNYVIGCTVDDGRGGGASDSIAVEVRDFSLGQSGNLVAWWPFDGSAADLSGNHYDGTVHGALPAPGHDGGANGAYAFNGTNAWIDVANAPGLNFQNAITVNFWMKIGAFFAREEYPISHGNWQNRWKISIGNQRLRFTVKTAAGTKDLDTETQLLLNRWYNVTALYDGAGIEIWLDGALDAFSTWSGAILTTTIDPTIGQVLPNDQNYNFQGSLDGIRIYDYPLGVAAIDSLAGVVTAVREPHALPASYSLGAYPNPFNPSTTIVFDLPSAAQVALRVYDILGRSVATLEEGRLAPGSYRRVWDGAALPSGIYFCRLTAGPHVSTEKLLLIR